MILNENKVEEITEKYKEGYILKNKERIFHQSMIGFRKSGVTYKFSDKELEEYSKCYNNPVYFIENYTNVKLRDYQIDVIKHYLNNRFPLYLMSREMGVYNILELLLLHEALFKNDKTIVILDNFKNDISYIREVYKDLPFFLKKGIIQINEKVIKFENRCAIYSKVVSKKLSFGFGVDYLLLKNVAYYNPTHFEKMYKSIFPTISARQNSRLILASDLNGYNHFYELVENSERYDGDPKKNFYNTMKIYWWQVSGRDQVWKQNKILEVGESFFNEKYDLSFKLN
jgi:hypothetical protein